MYKKLNYATGVLSSGISDSATEVVLKAGHTITTETGEANKFVGVFFDKAKSSPFQDVNREIVEAYRTGTNTFTITRAKEGTSAKSWVEDDNFMLIASSAVFDEYEAELNNKQDALGFTPENITNKKTTITDSDTDYPTGRAVKTALDGKEPTLTKGNLSGSGVITIDNTRQVIGGAATISHTDSATVRHVTDTEKATWNAKQNALGYTPENVANKRTSFQATPTDTAYISEKLAKDSLDAKENLANKKTTLTDNSDTYYPTQKAVKTAIDAKQDTLTFGIANTNAVKIDDAFVADNDYAKFTANGIEGVPYSTVLSDIGAQAALGFTPENVANKKISLTDSDVDYPTCKAVNTGLSGKQNTLGFTPENVANKKTSLADNSDTYYPSQKAVKTAVDAKAPIASPTLTGTVTLPKAVNIKDTSADHEYQLGVSELAANRTVTLPLLTGNDEFVFKAHTQTLTNKTLGTGSVINEATMTLGSDADGDVYYRASNKLTRLGKGTAGQVLTMNSEATAPQWSNPTAGGISWSVVTTDTTMAIDTGSLANKGTLLTLTLPATSAVGKTVRVAGMNAGLWKIAQGANQYIKFGNLSTTVGIGGSLASTQTYDAVELVCIEANKGWVVVSSIGNITVV